MSNEFKVRKGLFVNGSGSVLFNVQGSQGDLFSVTDSFTGSLFKVNDISGIPILNVSSDNSVVMGTFGAYAISVSGSTAKASGSFTGSFTGNLIGTARITGSLIVTGSTTSNAFIPTGTAVPTNGMYLSATNTLDFSTATTNRLSISSTGNINLNSAVYNNTVTAATVRNLFIGNTPHTIGGVSSIRASKKNIIDISNINWLYNLNTVSFNYRKKDEKGNYTEDFYDELVYGLIAEDTAPVADFLINYNEKEDGTKEMIGIEYSRLITPMLKAIQELKAENDTLKERLIALENK